MRRALELGQACRPSSAPSSSESSTPISRAPPGDRRRRPGSARSPAIGMLQWRGVGAGGVAVWRRGRRQRQPLAETRPAASTRTPAARAGARWPPRGRGRRARSAVAQRLELRLRLDQPARDAARGLRPSEMRVEARDRVAQRIVGRRSEIQLTTSAVTSVDPKTKRMIFVARLLRGWLRALARGSAIPDAALLRGVSTRRSDALDGSGDRTRDAKSPRNSRDCAYCASPWGKPGVWEPR